MSPHPLQARWRSTPAVHSESLVVSASNVAVIKLFLSKVKTANLPKIEQFSC